MIKRMSANELLVESFQELAQSRPIDRITVKDIVGNCGYSSASFYRHFHDKYDLMAWDYTRHLHQIMSKIGQGGYTWRQTLFEGAEYFHSQRTYLRNVLQHTTGRESYEKLMVDSNYESLYQCVLEHSGEGRLNRHTELLVRAYCMGTVRLCCEWVLGSFRAEPADIADLWEESLPLRLHSYLYDAE